MLRASDSSQHCLGARLYYTKTIPEMDPPNPNDYRYRQSQAPVSYSTSATTSATMAALSGYEPSLYSHDQMYHQPQQISYGVSPGQ